MKLFYTSLALAMLASPALAQKPCEELQAEIRAKLSTKGVQHFQLDIIENAQLKQQKVVGSCAGSTKKIIYTRHSKAQ